MEKINDKTKNQMESIRLAVLRIGYFDDFSLSLVNSSYVFAAEKFSVHAEINLKKLNHPENLKVVISANGNTETKYLIGKDLNSNTATVSFELDQKNDIVNAGSRDEYFCMRVCS